MKQALIDPTTSVQHIIGWTASPIAPIYATYPNSARVAEVTSTTFEVASPLFWTECADDIVADQWYYDTVALAIYPVVNAPGSEQSQPTVEGAQTL
jgi:hypothetical protein